MIIYSFVLQDLILQFVKSIYKIICFIPMGKIAKNSLKECVFVNSALKIRRFCPLGLLIIIHDCKMMRICKLMRLFDF